MQIIRQTLHVRDLVFDIVCVFVSCAVPQALHQACRRIPQMQRNRFGYASLHVLLNIRVSRVQRVRLGRKGEIDHRLRQRQIAFRHSDEVDCIPRCHAQ